MQEQYEIIRNVSAFESACNSDGFHHYNCSPQTNWLTPGAYPYLTGAYPPVTRAHDSGRSNTAFSWHGFRQEGSLSLITKEPIREEEVSLQVKIPTYRASPPVSIGREITELLLNSEATAIQDVPDPVKTFISVTVLNNEIYALSEHQITVYNIQDLTLIQNIMIHGMQKPAYLTGSLTNNTLYISDSKCVHRVSLIDNSITRWEVKERYIPMGISVTEQHNNGMNNNLINNNILVTVQVKDIDDLEQSTAGISGVVEYNDEGQPVREIKLDDSIEYAWYMEQIASDEFIVCHGLNSTLHRICKINAEKGILKIFGYGKGEGELLLNEPRSFTLDKNNKLIYVADTANNRVLVLDFDFNYLGVLQPHRVLCRPVCVYYDSPSQYLIIVEEFSDNIIIYSNIKIRT